MVFKLRYITRVFIFFQNIATIQAKIQAMDTSYLRFLDNLYKISHTFSPACSYVRTKMRVRMMQRVKYLLEFIAIIYLSGCLHTFE